MVVFEQERSTSSSHFSVGAARTCTGTGRATRKLLEEGLSWRRFTGATGGQIDSEKGEQIERLELLFARFRRRLALVLGRSGMARVGASPGWSRLAQSSPEGGDRQRYSSRKRGVGVRERKDKRKVKIFV